MSLGKCHWGLDVVTSYSNKVDRLAELPEVFEDANNVLTRGRVDVRHRRDVQNQVLALEQK